MTAPSSGPWYGWSLNELTALEAPFTDAELELFARSVVLDVLRKEAGFVDGSDPRVQAATSAAMERFAEAAARVASDRSPKAGEEAP